MFKTRGPKGHISCTWVPCTTFLTNPPGRPFLFTDRPKNTILEEDVRILLSVKFHWIPFRDFRGKIENISANQKPGWPSCFFYRPEKHKIGRGRLDLAICQVSLNSVQWFLKRSQKCFSQSEVKASILFFWLARKTQYRQHSKKCMWRQRGHFYMVFNVYDSIQ